MATWSSARRSPRSPGRRLRTLARSRRRRAIPSWSMGGVCSFPPPLLSFCDILKLIDLFSPCDRRLRPQDPLHLRHVLCAKLGPDHRLQQPLPLVLPRLFRCDDRPPRHARYPALQRKVWRGVGAV